MTRVFTFFFIGVCNCLLPGIYSLESLPQDKEPRHILTLATQTLIAYSYVQCPDQMVYPAKYDGTAHCCAASLGWWPSSCQRTPSKAFQKRGHSLFLKTSIRSLCNRWRLFLREESYFSGHINCPALFIRIATASPSVRILSAHNRMLQK